MEVSFADRHLERLETDATYTAGHARAIVRGFRKVMQMIRAAQNEGDLYALKSLRFEKLKGNRAHQRSLRINRQWRMIVELIEAHPNSVMKIVGIEDYH